MSSKLIFMILKAGNLVLVTIYSFTIVYTLIRVVGQASYPLVVSTAAIGNYVIATDFGYSGYIYYETRKHFIQKSISERVAEISEALWLYFAMAAVGGGIGALMIMAVAPAGLELRLALALFFVSVVLPLPWLLLRKIAAAIDFFVEFEFCELIRRAVFLGLSLTMLVGLPFLAFSILCLVAWAICFTVALVLLARQRLKLTAASPRSVLKHLKLNWPKIFRSGSLSVMEFMLYNFPYACLPFMYGSGPAVVAFDIFYKVCRFGTQSYAVPAEAALPFQTRAYYEGRWRQVWLYFAGVLGLASLICAVASTLVLGFGGPMFGALLNKHSIVTAPVRVAMAAMLAAMAVQNSAGTWMVNTGLQGRLAKLTLITVSLMTMLVLACLVVKADFVQFLSGYVAIYWLHAGLYVACFVHFMGQVRRKAGTATLAEATEAVV